jgi:transcription initiation factor TFIIH subunit 2
VRVSCFALSAELHICRKLAEETAGTMGVCLDKPHFKQWLYGQCIPPPALHRPDEEMKCEMIQMGFPTRTTEAPSLVHASREKTIIAKTAYTCPQCQAKNSQLPSDCSVCGLKLVLAPHLARSFHHLFPVQPFVERPLLESRMDVDETPSTARSQELTKTTASITTSDSNVSCFACLKSFGYATVNVGMVADSVVESLRFQCPDCSQYFCVDCDAFLHGNLHNCPGCLRRF